MIKDFAKNIDKTRAIEATLYDIQLPFATQKKTLKKI